MARHRPFQYGFARKPVGTTPGTGNYVFQPFSTLPLHSPGGTGITYLQGMRAVQEPQTYIKQSQIVDGFNGITAGDVQLTGLVNLEDHLVKQLAGQANDPLFQP